MTKEEDFVKTFHVSDFHNTKSCLLTKAACDLLNSVNFKNDEKFNEFKFSCSNTYLLFREKGVFIYTKTERQQFKRSEFFTLKDAKKLLEEYKNFEIDKNMKELEKEFNG